jgi:outer membrane protein insertion porin family
VKLWLLGLLFILSAIPLSAQQNIITSIDVTGNRRIPTETVKSKIFSRPGDIYDQAAIERDFNALWNTHYFQDIRFEREDTDKGIKLHIYVQERPTIREIKYTGLSSVSTSDVLDAFKKAKVSLTQESQYDPTVVKRAEVIIKQMLAERGRQFATVKTEIHPLPPAAISITFAIKEGTKVKVGKIAFQGNQHIGGRELESSMKLLKPLGVPHSIFLEHLFAKTYDSSKLEDDIEHVREEYQNHGYFKVIVEDPKTNLRDTGHEGFHIPLIQKGPGKAMDITIPLVEGDQYRLGSITFKNNKAAPNIAQLRAQFPIKDGDIFSRDKIVKGLDNLRKAYGTLGYINFTPVPDTKPDDVKKIVDVSIDLDEGKQFFVRRIEFAGNTTTRDKVIRREILLEEGQPYNQKLWEFSLQRLNQLGYFDDLKPDDPDVTEIHKNEQEGTVDLTLKVKEKGKNSIGLSGGVSGLSGSFIGLNYSTNNFLGLGETLSIQGDIGTLQRDITFGFTEPYLFSRPYQLGFTVYDREFKYNQAQEEAILTGQSLNIPQSELQNLQNYTQNSKGFTLTVSHQLHRSLKRVGLTYSFDSSSIVALTTASQNLFNFLQFEGLSGPNSLNGIITSRIYPTFSYNKLDSGLFPHSGSSLSVGVQLAGLGGTVRSFEPIIDYKKFFPVQNHKNTIAFHVMGAFITGYGGVVAPPFERFYMGGEQDIRGFDVRTISPVAFLPSTTTINLTNPDGTIVPKDKTNPQRGNYTIQIPTDQPVFPGGDLNLVGNLEYRITIAPKVAIAPFADLGFDPVLRTSQLQVTTPELSLLNNTKFGCPNLDIGLNCIGLESIKFPSTLTPAAGTNWVPRMSTGLELQVFLPVVNAPFRIYYAYNPLRLDTVATPPIAITRSMFPAGAAGDFTYQSAISVFSPPIQLREPRKTFRFTVATTF